MRDLGWDPTDGLINPSLSTTIGLSADVPPLGLSAHAAGRDTSCPEANDAGEPKVWNEPSLQRTFKFFDHFFDRSLTFCDHHAPRTGPQKVDKPGLFLCGRCSLNLYF